MAGIEDVAKLAGVSTATVSRALSGKDHVSEKAMLKVKKAAEQLGYVASSSAYGMATGKTRNIGVVVPFVDRWFFSELLESVETVMRARGYDLTLYNLSGGEKQRHNIFNEFLLRKRVDGVLACAVRFGRSELESLSKVRKPIVGLGGPIEGARTVSIDDVEAGRLATEHLIALGHTRIAIIGGNEESEMDFSQPDLRRRGYEDALKSAGLPVDENLFIPADFTLPGGYSAAKQLIGDPRSAPTAIFAISDEMAFGAYLAAKDLGMRVPEQLSIIGVDDHELSEFFGITTISQQVAEQGAHALNKLIELIENAKSSDPINIEENEIWPLELVVRGSTARAPLR